MQLLSEFRIPNLRLNPFVFCKFLNFHAMCTSYPACIQQLAHSFAQAHAHESYSIPLYSKGSALFRANTGGIGVWPTYVTFGASKGASDILERRRILADPDALVR